MCVCVTVLCVCVCECCACAPAGDPAVACEDASRGGGGGGGGAGGGGGGGGWGRGPAQKCLRPAKGAPDREHPLHPRPRRSSGFLEAECGGARGPPGGNPGLQRESGPRPPTPGGAGRQATALSAVGCEGPAAGGACGGGGRALKERGGKKKKKEKEKKRKEKPTAPGIPRRSPIQVLTRPDPA